MSVRRNTVLATILVLLLGYLLRHYGQGEKGSITDWVKPGDKSGEFKRGQSVFRNFIENKSGAQFPPEKDRYHLYVSYACPWGMLKLLLC
jgi:putative glutathione S-transferase